MTSIGQEIQMGAQAYNQIKSDPKMRPSQDPREIEPVKRVAARIVEAAKRSKYAEMAQQFQWEVTVIKDDKTANAFALPGGKMAVYTGIFPMAKTEAGLAAVMGHEVVHALARHGAERMSQGQLPTRYCRWRVRRLGSAAGIPCSARRRWRRLAQEHRLAFCCLSVASMNLRPIIWDSSSQPMPAMIHVNRSHSGNEWGKHRAVGDNLNFYPPIQATIPELNN